MSKNIHWIVILLCLGLLYENPATAKIEPLSNTVVRQLVTEHIIIEKEVQITGFHFRQTRQAYFHQVSTDDYLALAKNHKAHAHLLEEIVECKTLASKTADPNVFNYWIHLAYDYTIYILDIYLQATQRFYPAKDIHGEARIEMTLTSEDYADKIKSARMTTLITPHQSGILVVETVDLEMRVDGLTGKAIRMKISGFLSRLIRAFRTELESST